MLKYWRLWLLLVVVLGSLLAIGLKPRRTGVEIVYVTRDSPASGQLQQGMAISRLNEYEIRSMEDWNKYAPNLKGPVTLTADSQRYEFFVNESLGIEAQELQRLNLDFGLDLRGGTRIILKPRENATRDMIDQVISTLQTRINIYGLREIKFFPVESPDGWYVQIEATGVGSDIVDDLLSSKGSFEAKISKPVEIRGGTGRMQLGSSFHDVEVVNGTVSVDGREVPTHASFEIDDIEFELSPENVTNNKVIFTATVYKGEDIELVYTDPQHSGIVPVGDVYRFYFTMLVSNAGAQRFAAVTSGIPSQMDLNTGDYYLKDCMIFLYLDDELKSSLRISSTLGGQAYQTPQIEGGRESLETAAEEKMRLQTILRSGALPVSMETSSISIISPTLGANFIQSALLAAMAAGIVVVIIIFIRYRSLRIGIPLVLTGLSEAVIILGISAMNDSGVWMGVLLVNLIIIALVWWKLKESDVSAWIGAMLIPMLGLMSWNIDLPAIGGIIAAIGVGVDQMVVIADETLGGKKIAKKIYSLKERIGKAFFIIFTAATTTIAALLPLLFVAAGVFIRGFVITTIVGILVGILITRPAYAKIIEMTVEKKEEQ